MTVVQIAVRTPRGVSHRAASEVVLEANKHEAYIWIQKDDRTVNAKSLLGLLNLNIRAGDIIRICSESPSDTQEQVAIKAMCDLLTNPNE